MSGDLATPAMALRLLRDGLMFLGAACVLVVGVCCLPIYVVVLALDEACG